MAISFVNFSGGGQQAGPFTTVVSPAQAVSSGNSLVVGIRWSASIPLSDNAGNTYVPLPHLIGQPAFNTGDGFQFFYCNNCVGNPNLQVTATLLDTGTNSRKYTAIAVWNISGGPLIFDQQFIGLGNSGTATTPSFSTKYPNSIACLLDIDTAGLSTYGVNAPLSQDGGTSLGGQQIAGAGHAIYSTLQSSTILSMTQTSGTWQIGGPVFGVNSQIPPIRRRRSAIVAAPPMFIGRMYDYFITLERVWPLS